MNYIIAQLVKRPKIAAFLVVGLFLFLPFGPASISTPDVAYSVQTLESCANPEDCIRGGATEPVGEVDDAGGRVVGVFQFAVNVLSWVVAATSVIMIIFGAFKVITSAGDQNSIAVGRKAIVYALAGLVVALFAQVLVRFVLTSLE
jgi:hypothetical protein